MIIAIRKNTLKTAAFPMSLNSYHRNHACTLVSAEIPLLGYSRQETGSEIKALSLFHHAGTKTGGFAGSTQYITVLYTGLCRSLWKENRRKIKDDVRNLRLLMTLFRQCPNDSSVQVESDVKRTCFQQNR